MPSSTLLICDLLDLSFPRRWLWTLLSSGMGSSVEIQRKTEGEREVFFINSLKCFCCVSFVVAEYNRSNERCWNGKEWGNRNNFPTAILWNTNPTRTVGSNLSLRSDRPATKLTTLRGGKVTMQCSLIEICRRLGGTSLFSLHGVTYHTILIDEYYWYLFHKFLYYKPTRCTISQIYFDIEIYMFRTDLLSINRSLNTGYTTIGICHASYVDCLLARSVWDSWWWTVDLSETCKVLYQNKF
jgi:hypothetical protein